MDLTTLTDALRAAQERGVLPTTLDTAGLRELGAEVLAKSIFTAKGTNAIFANELKKIIDELAGGKIGEGQARTAIWEILDVLKYDADKGGFPGEELEPAIKGSIQDLKSFRRRDLIVRTQLALMSGAGTKMRGSTAERLSTFPAWELMRVGRVEVARDWPARWALAGGQPAPVPVMNGYKILGERTGMVALKGDPVWGELGSYGNFTDALGVDHPPWCFNSEMGWREVPRGEVLAAGITGPDGEPMEEWLASAPVTLTGRQPLPSPQISMRDVDPEIRAAFQAAVMAETGGKPYVVDYSDLLAEALKTAADAYSENSR